jgi:hypothetical protein
MPRKGQGGKYLINFDGKFTQRSIKNAILLDRNEQTAIVVRRIGPEDLEIENSAGFSDFVCFGFAIVSWLCTF